MIGVLSFYFSSVEMVKMITHHCLAFSFFARTGTQIKLQFKEIEKFEKKLLFWNPNKISLNRAAFEGDCSFVLPGHERQHLKERENEQDL